MMSLDEMRALRRLLEICGIAYEGTDAADNGPNRIRDLERVTLYVQALQTTIVNYQMSSSREPSGE
jgi:hypothetical protein